ncbi:hypothetical protein SS50377_26638 [Spironucleus salmonicida]|uniref:Uncharacterized protein n=1 Tax=Spironucleus salmonicida TaxID=348837 RepID=V6LAP3_9EUKA|nr:hypothetical protein SS50377_26631 [Spironucleus salmonicida]KAH0572428.1 hypothetical protein SS50377_26638 [Spironucleus salmonicida]|eukprot:EST41482.1 hypothetical protein SS50377_19209 [Spironucleus salmonicida]
MGLLASAQSFALSYFRGGFVTRPHRVKLNDTVGVQRVLSHATVDYANHYAGSRCPYVPTLQLAVQAFQLGALWLCFGLPIRRGTPWAAKRWLVLLGIAQWYACEALKLPFETPERHYVCCGRRERVVGRLSRATGAYALEVNGTPVWSGSVAGLFDAEGNFLLAAFDPAGRAVACQLQTAHAKRE